MWADNETEIDLLGFDYLVDELVVALTEPRLLPLTVGVLGDWGSGKSSLMRMAHASLQSPVEEGKDKYIGVSFSPWQHEDYDDVKSALMAAVLDRLAKEPVADDEGRLGAMQRFVKSLRRRGRSLGRVAAGATPVLITAAAAGVSPELAFDPVGTAQGVAGALASEATREPDDESDVSTSDHGIPEITSVREFRQAFRDYVARLQGVAAVVVFIDDLDRCLPESVVDTFEAIRLFLNAPKTAYVVAANQKVVESAIDSRYPELRREDGTGVGADYLEKMLQLKVAIPALSAPEVESYANLLLADLHLGEDDLRSVIRSAKERRSQDNLTVAFNIGIATDILGDISTELARDLLWVAEVAPALATGLRGNPRQVKRFLNTIFLRRRSAARREVSLDPAVLAKLLVLEEQQVHELQTLFDWQVAAEGKPRQLAEAELVARGDTTAGLSEDPTSDEQPVAERPARRRGGGSADDRRDEEAASEGALWAAKPRVREWLRLDPHLRDIDLRPYFTYSRDRLSPGVAASRLPADLQALVLEVQSEVSQRRRAAVEVICGLDADKREQVVGALAATIERNPLSPAVDAAIELAEKAPDSVGAIVRTLDRVPHSVFPPAKAMSAVRRLPREHPAVIGLLDAWQRSTVTGLANMVATGRKRQEGRS